MGLLQTRGQPGLDNESQASQDHLSPLSLSAFFSVPFALPCPVSPCPLSPMPSPRGFILSTHSHLPELPLYSALPWLLLSLHCPYFLSPPPFLSLLFAFSARLLSLSLISSFHNILPLPFLFSQLICLVPFVTSLPACCRLHLPSSPLQDCPLLQPFTSPETLTSPTWSGYPTRTRPTRIPRLINPALPV